MAEWNSGYFLLRLATVIGVILLTTAVSLVRKSRIPVQKRVEVLQEKLTRPVQIWPIQLVAALLFLAGFAGMVEAFAFQYVNHITDPFCFYWIILLVIGIGLYYRKNWARICAIIILCIEALSMAAAWVIYNYSMPLLVSLLAALCVYLLTRIDALRFVGDQRSFEELVTVAMDGTNDISKREKAVEALGELGAIGDHRVIACLLEAIQRDGEIRIFAKGALFVLLSRSAWSLETETLNNIVAILETTCESHVDDLANWDRESDTYIAPGVLVDWLKVRSVACKELMRRGVSKEV